MVSVIIAAYNAAKTIKKAIDSCLNQTYKDIEVVIVNDASTDNTKEVVLDIAAKDSRVKYFENEINLGAGGSRKVGVHSIQGDYSLFLDSDDYLAEDCIEQLLNAAIEHSADLVSSGFIVVKEGIITETRKSDELLVLEGMDKYRSMIRKLNIFLCGCLMKKCLWNNVEYSEERFIEDTPTIVKLLWYANKRVYIPYAGYYYTQNAGSLIHTASKFKEWVFRTLCTISNIEFFKDKEPKMFTMDLLKMVLSELKHIKVDKEEYFLYKDKLDFIIDYFNKNIDG